jgi:hypothetical protein
MAYTLIGKQGKLTLRDSDFPQLLRLAKFYGWEPEGTVKPEEHGDKPWNSGEYLTCEGQRVRNPDAKRLARALKLSLSDIPDHAFKGAVSGSSSFEARFDGNSRKKKSVTNLIRYFSGEDKKKIREFVAYTAKGGFRIC